MIQSIDGTRKIINHTRFGCALQRTARGLLSYSVTKQGYGFQDGGCQLFAEALYIWSDGQLRPRAAYTGNRAQHVFVQGQSIAFDSDGIAIIPDMRRKLELLECLVNVRFGNYRWGQSPTIPRDMVESEYLARMIGEELGCFRSIHEIVNG